MKGSGAFGALAGGCQATNTSRNSAYIAAFNAKTAPTPAREITTRAMAGPTARAALMLIDESAAAECSWARGTRSGTRAWYAGRVRTEVLPIRKVKEGSRTGGISPVGVR